MELKEAVNTWLSYEDSDRYDEEKSRKVIEARITIREALRSGYKLCKIDEDCIRREEALKHTHIEYDDDGIGHRVVYAEDIEELPSVTPSIPEVEDNFDIGYNCGYADAMCDIGGEE